MHKTNSIHSQRSHLISIDKDNFVVDNKRINISLSLQNKLHFRVFQMTNMKKRPLYFAITLFVTSLYLLRIFFCFLLIYSKKIGINSEEYIYLKRFLLIKNVMLWPESKEII